MTRTPRSRRLILVGALTILGLTACGSDRTATGTPTSDAPASSVATTVKTPAVIVLGDQAGRDAASASPMAADQSAGADEAIAEGELDSKMAWPVHTVYEFSGPPPELPANAVAWYFPAGGSPSDEQIAELAAALGVDGDIVAIPKDEGGGWRVGPADYTGPTVNVYGDGMLSWWYSSNSGGSSVPCAETLPVDEPAPGETSLDQTMEELVDDEQAAEVPELAAVSGPAPDETATASTDASKPGAAVSEPAIVPDCMEMVAPEGVPTAEQAEQLARELFASLGMDPASYEFEVYADEWNASVTAYLVLDGIRTNVMANVGYGGDAELTWASGFFGTPVRGDEYPLIGVQGGIDRLNEQAASWAEPAVLEGEASDAGDAAVSGPADEGAASSAAEEPVAPSDTQVARPAETVGPTETEEYIEPEPETVVVTFVDVAPSLEQVWAADGTVWLLPGYQFRTADEGWYSVLAVQDQFLQQSDGTEEPQVDPAQDPSGTDSGTGVAGDPGSSASCGATMAVDAFEPGALEADDVQFLLGMCTKDAIGTAESLGFSVRVVREDGTDLAVTEDFVESRVNVAVVDGVVTEIVSVG